MKNVILKLIIPLVFFVILSSAVFSATRRGQDLVAAGHWVYDALAQIQIDTGRWHFVDYAPLSVQNIQSILDDVPYERLSEAGKIQYKRIQDYIAEFDFSLDAGIFSIGIEPKANVEGYFKTNDDLDWVYGNHERQRTVEVPFRITVGDYLTVFMGFAVGQRRSYLENEKDNYVNHFFVEDAFDPNLTHSTYLSAGYQWQNGVGLNFNFGYGKQNFGRAALGSTILSDYLTDIPYLQFLVRSPIFVYSFNIKQFNPKTTFYSHTIDFRLFKKLTVGFMEGGAAYDCFSMEFINPFGLFHAYELNNHYDWISFFGLKASFAPTKNFRIYYLNAMTEHQMPSEGRGDNDLPEGKAYQAGVDLQFPVKQGFLKFNLEGYYAQPFFGIKQSPNYSLISAKEGAYEWVGSPLGPDCVSGRIGAEYEAPGKWSLGLNYTFAVRGELSAKDIFRILSEYGWTKGEYDYNEDDWIYSPDVSPRRRTFKAPHGTAEYDSIITLRASWQPLNWLTVVAQPSYVFAANYNHESGRFEHGFEIALSCRMDFCRLAKRPVNFDFLLKEPNEWKSGEAAFPINNE